MALKTRDDFESKRKQGQVPPNMKDCYVLRCRDAKVQVSAAGNRNIALECEFVDPVEKEFGGKVYDLSALKHTFYLSLEDPDESSDGINQTFDVMETLELEPVLDPEEPDTKQFEGLVFEAIIDSVERKQMKPDPTKKGKMIPITNAEGKEISSGWQTQAFPNSICGLANVETQPML